VTEPSPIDALLERMGTLLLPLVETRDERRHFLAVYMRTTANVKEELEQPRLGGFVDPGWTERWDVAFAGLYLDAIERWNEDGSAPGPWQVAFEAATSKPRLPPLRHLLLGMNAHINYDLPQSLLAVIDDAEFDDPDLIARRSADHLHIDEILTNRVPQEDQLLRQSEQPGDRTTLDRVLTPLNRAATKRFLTEARAKVWRNAQALSAARRDGPSALKTRLDELGVRCAERVADLRRPGQVILRLRRHGFGVLLDAA
jgi:Family of unknown function (DUF5995)